MHKGRRDLCKTVPEYAACVSCTEERAFMRVRLRMSRADIYLSLKEMQSRVHHKLTCHARAVWRTRLVILHKGRGPLH